MVNKGNITVVKLLLYNQVPDITTVSAAEEELPISEP
jgi:hypothetical protein